MVVYNNTPLKVRVSPAAIAVRVHPCAQVLRTAGVVEPGHEQAKSEVGGPEVKVCNTAVSQDWDHLRPELFPLDLWRYVSRAQRPRVKGRFQKLADHSAERLEECVRDVLTKLDVGRGKTFTAEELRCEEAVKFFQCKLQDTTSIFCRGRRTLGWCAKVTSCGLKHWPTLTAFPSGPRQPANSQGSLHDDRAYGQPACDSTTSTLRPDSEGVPDGED